MTVHRIFTISAGTVQDGTLVQSFSVSGGAVTIPAVLVGEQGRGRSLGVLPVQLPNQLHTQWQQRGQVTIRAAQIGQTRSGRPKLIVPHEDLAPDDSRIIAVLRTPIGFRGGNEHTGDRTGESTRNVWGEEVPVFRPFPGEVLLEGIIAQGAAGRAGSGRQLVALIPRGVVFRTGYSGRLYGGPRAHYYLWDGERLLAATWDERQVADLF
jgi:hypothetical protein